MLMKIHVVAIVTITLASGTAAFHRTYFNWWNDFLCSNIWLEDDGPFETERISEFRTFTGSNMVDVGTCPRGSCSNKTYIHNYACDTYGFICPVTETRTVNLGVFGTREYEYVTSCMCCEDTGLVVSIRAVDSVTEAALENVVIRFSEDFQGNTNDNGYFVTSIDRDTSSLVINGEDQNQQYVDAVKIVDIPPDFLGPLEVTLKLIKMAEAVEIDSRSSSTLSISNDPANPDAGKAKVEIEPFTFRRSRGRPYRGKVSARITFIDTNTDSESIIPGRFLTPTADGVENMISDGIFSMDFKDEDGNSLGLGKPVRITIASDMRLWNLNKASGYWVNAGEELQRRKRQVELTITLLLDIVNGQWVNIDKIPGAPRCYFKARIFNWTNGDEIVSSQTASFRPDIVAYTSVDQRLRLYTGYTNTPADTCFEVRCPEFDIPQDALFGFIGMTSTESVSVGGLSLPFTTYLLPRYLNDYILPIRNRHSAVEYAIAPNDQDIFVNFISDAAGPFYPSKTACENTPVQRPAFHYFKLPLPSYEPVPDGTEFCTARIAFLEEWNFYSYIDDVEFLANVTAISVWGDANQRFYYTDTVQLQHGGNETDYFVYACVKYRCSETDDETVVYLDIAVPNVTYTYNNTNENGDVFERSYSYPEFYCYGDCSGPLCSQGIVSEGKGNNGTSIEGSFIAPENVGSGPDFYDSVDTDCDERSSNEPFAYEFYCYSNRQGGQDSPA